MKLTAIFILAATLTASARISAQVTLSEKKASLEKVLQLIKKQSGYDLVYDVQLVRQKGQPVDVTVNNVPVAQALKEVFKDQPLTYEIVEGRIISVKALEIKKAVFEPEFVQPPAEVTGTVLNDKNQALEGASITVKGNKKGVVSDIAGRFRLNNLTGSETIIVAFTGYQSQEIPLNNRPNVIIRLIASTSELDALQVVAYGKVSKRFNTGAVTTVTSQDIERQPVTNPLQALAGRVPGLTVVQSSGIPGSSIQINIRGRNSLNGNFSPLIVIDGVVFASQNNNLNQLTNAASPITGSGSGQIPGQSSNPDYAGSGISPLSLISPTDIESIEVLRDADATAIYGAQGANGVLLITTKKGKPGKTTYTFTVNTGASTISRYKKLVNLEQYRTARKEAYASVNIIPNTTLGSPGYALDLTAFDSTRDVNWLDYFFGGVANMTRVDASISGGTANTQFSFGAAYNRQTNIYPGDFATQNGSMRLNINHRSDNQKFEINTSIYYANNVNNNSGSPSVNSAYNLPPNAPEMLDSLGKLVWVYAGRNIVNNMAYLFQTYKSEANTFNASANLRLHLLPGLSFRSILGYNAVYNNEFSTAPLTSQRPPTTNNSSARGNARSTNWSIEPYFDYNKNFGKNYLSITAGMTFRRYLSSSATLLGRVFANDALLGNISSAANITANTYSDEYKFMGYFARLGYRLQDRYILNVNLRRDGSSRFGPGKQFGNFGSVSAGWIFSEEQFFKTQKIFSFGKLRSSFGLTGNDGIGSYQYLSTWGSTIAYGNSYQNIPGLSPQILFNPELQWESVKKLDFGLELGMLSDRVLLNINYYRNIADNQLIRYPLPIQTGFDAITANDAATILNKGWEIQASSTNIKSKNFYWSTSFNISFNRNKLLAYPDLNNSPFYWKYQIGRSTSLVQMYDFQGVDPVTGLAFFDTKGSDRFNPTGDIRGDMIFVDLAPKYFGGLRNTLHYKDFELDFLFEFKNQIIQNYRGQIANMGTMGVLYPVEELNRWKQPGDITNIPRFMHSTSTAFPFRNNRSNYQISTAAYSDGSYIRLKTVSLSYSVSDKLISRIKAKSAKIYVNAQNLFTITKYLGHDPESGQFYRLPTLRTIEAGLNISF